MSTELTTGVISSAEYIAKNSTEVFVSEKGCKQAANSIYESMKLQQYSTETWASHPLNPKEKTKETVDWIFMVDLLNFSFWSDYDDSDSGHPRSQRYSVKYNDELYTGYWSLVAAINKALDAGIPITSPKYWASPEFTKDVLAQVLKSETEEQVPLFEKRFEVLKEAGKVLITVCAISICFSLYGNSSNTFFFFFRDLVLIHLLISSHKPINPL